MGTRSTQIVGAYTAIRAIEAALRTGKLSNEDLGNILEIVADSESPGSVNFTVVSGLGEDDDHWLPKT
jgi:hypothetical protein